MNERGARGLLVAALAVVVLLGTGRLARAGFFEFQNLLASDGASGDAFGYSVALCGDYGIVGAVSGGAGAGAAYVFNWTGTTWTEQAKLTASDAAVGDNFGASVAISGDYAIIGAGGNDDAGLSSGSAYVFNRSGSAWSEQAKLTASDAAANDEFGRSVGISGDYAIVGGRGNDDAGSASGSAYVFNRSGTAWSEQAKLTASDAAAGDYFGWSVGISGDYAIVGAYADDSFTGSAYVFNRSGSAWSEQSKLIASDAVVDDRFGESVGIWGERAIVGATSNDDLGHGSGSAYMYHTPEPSGMVALVGLGLMGGAAHLWRRRRRKG